MENSLDLFSICPKITALDSISSKIRMHNIYLFKVNKRNTRKSCKIYCKLKQEERQNDLHLVSLLLNLNVFASFSSVRIVDYEEVNGASV